MTKQKDSIPYLTLVLIVNVAWMYGHATLLVLLIQHLTTIGWSLAASTMATCGLHVAGTAIHTGFKAMFTQGSQ